MSKYVYYCHQLTLFLVICIFTSACLDEYNPPEITNSDNILVVEGNITNVETNIRLTQTTNLSNDNTTVVNNALVVLENEDNSFQFNLLSKSQGFYSATVPLNQTDRYRIRIQTEGDEYVSEYLPILPTPPIDSVSWESVDDRFQVQVTTTGNENTSQYYLWNFEETWEYRSRYPSFFVYTEEEEIRRRTDEEQLYICWQTEASTTIEIGTTVDLSQNVVFKEPIHVIEPTENLKLSRRYSILVKQYAISKEAFEFWELLKQNSEELGTLFDPQPSQLPTNLTCVNDPDKPVIGFLSASEEQQERMFVDRRELPFSGVPFATVNFCPVDTVSLDPIDLRIAFGSGGNLITYGIENMMGIIVGYEAAPRSCVDCTSFGGTTEEPDFW